MKESVGQVGSHEMTWAGSSRQCAKGRGFGGLSVASAVPGRKLVCSHSFHRAPMGDEGRCHVSFVGSTSILYENSGNGVFVLLKYRVFVKFS